MNALQAVTINRFVQVLLIRIYWNMLLMCEKIEYIPQTIHSFTFLSKNELYIRFTQHKRGTSFRRCRTAHRSQLLRYIYHYISGQFYYNLFVSVCKPLCITSHIFAWPLISMTNCFIFQDVSKSCFCLEYLPVLTNNSHEFDNTTPYQVFRIFDGKNRITV